MLAALRRILTVVKKLRGTVSVGQIPILRRHSGNTLLPLSGTRQNLLSKLR
ncbi:hypothetical protein [Dongia sp.]|uniref:hypothetical protein n=1 Tax=Dongia sp. TaxID=1977262 RepID=UPI0035B42641